MKQMWLLRHCHTLLGYWAYSYVLHEGHAVYPMCCSPLGSLFAGHAFEVVVGQSFLDWTTDEHGDSPVVKLLHV